MRCPCREKGQKMKQYSKSDVVRAGDVLIKESISETNPVAFEEAMQILSYWRACHEASLNHAVKMLNQAVQKYDAKAVIAKRLKRTPSIVRKLKRFEKMNLRTMQDIGGCRAILSNEKRVQKLVRDLKKRKEFRIRDYIKNPKEDGYRSIHLVSNFPNDHGGEASVEIQVRTAAQHAWATAVEIIDLFTEQAIKANQGNSEWREFFRRVGDQLAFIEDIPLYNQISPDRLAME
jgi:ppGpp synthetase/RelA/SpoT-type nucleotidyltranferase